MRKKGFIANWRPTIRLFCAMGTTRTAPAAKPLPPEREGPLERCAAQEKGRGDARPAQDRQRHSGMRRQIVVKRNGDGKRLSSASRTRRGEEVRRWNDSVTRAEVLDHVAAVSPALATS